ncbi:fungal-specific transcription factor domain-containing protein [Mycena polygramma]|nr:fungal-specific transcription factor domain-containing protein [Mycena polygramma]
MSWPANAPAYTLPFGEYDDEDDHEPDTPPGGAGGTAKEKAVRRRSSKACDQCRKSKCKCERPGPGEPCRSCVVLGTECTSLGPSRKRGPPKGYIDAIEARLHQTEALVGILLAAANYSGSRKTYSIEEEDEQRGRKEREAVVDERARGLLSDLAEDPLARAILARIDQSAYGPSARRAAAGASPASSNHSPIPNGSGNTGSKGGGGDLASTHPSHEWMDRVTAHILRRGRSSNSNDPRHPSRGPGNSNSNSSNNNNHAFASPVHTQAPISQRHLTHSRSFEHHSPARSSPPSAAYAYAQQHASRQLHTRHSASQLNIPPQRPAIITALPQGQSYHPLSADAGAGSASARMMPLSAGAGTDGRRLRRRVDGGPEYAEVLASPGVYQEFGAYRDGTAFRDASVSGVPSFQRRQRSRSYSPEGSGSEAELDVDVPSASPAPRGERYAGGGEGYRAREGRDRSLAEGLAGAVGQLSLNEDKQVRYHGKASGLHLLARREPEGDRGRTQARTGTSTTRETLNGHAEADGQADGDDTEVGRNVGGIWRFPKARVWPAAPADDDYGSSAGEADADGLPPRAAQEELLARYFAHVHPSFPVVHKRAVLEAWARGEGPPPLLLLAMYALAARHAPQPPSSSLPDAPSQYMWPAGDAYLFRAKGLLDSSYASSRASTCQALLLMGFREIGIGAMAQAWIYIGMAVRMAQDLGMQRGAYIYPYCILSYFNTLVQMLMVGEGGMTGPRGEDGKLFGVWEIAERRRIWYACVIMDKYVSTYIGRPLAIFERDFDTSLPSESDLEEMEEWVPPADAPVSFPPRAGRVISCFNESARLAGILSQIVQSIYALRPAGSRHAELVVLDGQLDRWRLALPAHLHHDPARSTRGGGVGEVPLPQVLTLHMQYWCAVLLLHRPFIRQSGVRNKHSPAPEEGDVRRNAEQNYELCASAANHITTIATLYSETYTLKHCAVFLCYYIFTASIMHVTSLSAYPTDPQARLGLAKCMDALKQMDIVWPAAGRAFELLRGAQANLADAEADLSGGRSSSTLVSRITRKRSATQTLDDSFAPVPGSENFLPLRQFTQGYSANGHYAHETRSPVAYYPPSASPYERWPAEDGAALPFQGSVLSTAVLGPAYSTGLVDDRRPPPVHEGEPRFGQPQHQQQYWNDYAAFPPGLGPVYGELHDPALAVHTEPHYSLHEFSLYNQTHHGHGP